MENITATLAKAFKTLANVLLAPLKSLKRRMAVFFNLYNQLTKNLTKGVSKIKKMFSEKPRDLKDYVPYRDKFYAKKLLIVIAVIVLGIPLLFAKVIWPNFIKPITKTAFYINEEKLATFSGTGIIYNLDGDMIYKGSLQSGKCTGEGEVYENGILVYRGSLLNENYFGNGVLYEKNGTIKYSGGFADNNYYGFGILFDIDTRLPIYEGNFINSLYNGYGKEYDGNSNLIYEGNFLEGKYSGNGSYYENFRLRYSGNFKDGKYEEHGREYDDNGDLRYEGTFSYGNYNGEGKYYENGDLKYSGNFINGIIEGYGFLYSDGRKVYDGLFAGGRYNGTGTLYFSDGTTEYSGDFYNGRYSGKGYLYSPKGFLIYEGEFKEGTFWGGGKLYESDYGRLIYEGGFSEGLFDGFGVYYIQTGGRKAYEGEFKKGYLSGFGILYNESSRKIFEGEFIDGHIDYLYFLGMKESDLKTVFLGYDTVNSYKEAGFDIHSYENVDAGFFVKTYPDEETENITLNDSGEIIKEIRYVPSKKEGQVLEVALWGGQNVFGFTNTNTLSEIEDVLGPCVEKSWIETGYGQVAVLINNNFNKYRICSEEYDLVNLYYAKFLSGGCLITAYFASETGGCLYYTMR